MDGNQTPPANMQGAQPQPGLKEEFMYGDKEAPNKNKPVMKIGRSWATALSGFLAGVVVASLVLVPWLFFLSKLCPSQVPHL